MTTKPFGMLISATLLATAAPAQSPAQTSQDSIVHVNQIQVVGTHNSYHAGFALSEAALMREKDPKAFEALDYSHPSLDAQLSAGIRQIEIDIYADTKGGRFAHPAITSMVAAAHLPADPELDPDDELKKPGFKVLHVVGIDQRSTCKTFVKCLGTVRAWSVAHPQHLPLFILVETKYDKPKAAPPPYAVPSEPFTPSTFDALDAEIRSVFHGDEMITPDLVRGANKTLAQAIAQRGWPTLAQARGKVILLMDQASMTPIYTVGHPGLRGRILFTNETSNSPDAAFVEQNDGTPEAIEALVKQGFLVRTRTDEPTKDARANNTTRRDRALSSGAQLLSTDYPASEPARWPGHYHVELPGNHIARCNPVNKPVTCRDDLLEGDARDPLQSSMSQQR